MAHAPALVILCASGRNDNYRTIFDRRVWGVTEGNTARKHIAPGTMVVFFRNKAVVAVARVSRVRSFPTARECDALWERISWSNSRERRDGLVCAKMFALDRVATPGWTKAYVKGRLGLKPRDNVQNGRRVRCPEFEREVAALLS